MSREPISHYGNLERMIRQIREHRALDLNAETWCDAHPNGTFEQWDEQAAG
ncbi:MAG: hypothetical protein VX603_06275 [Gemmatimonadota bacterium]|nr:hypothetical protein [Gemmatimonadota bacterium]